jgi:hypothetical protein
MTKDQHIDFEKAELIEINHESKQNKSLSIISHNITGISDMIHNGRSNFTFSPEPDIFKYEYKLRVYRDPEFFVDFNITGTNPFLTTMMTIDEDFQNQKRPDFFKVDIYQNKRFNATDRNIKLRIKNNDQIVYEKELGNMTNVNKTFPILKKDLYVNSTNGGVLYISLLDDGWHDEDTINLSRKLFLMPREKVNFTISPSKTSYSPGEKVNIDILMDPIADEKFYASIVVTDVSSYQRVPTFKHGPSLPSMVYLENEVTKGDKGEFLYSQEFIDLFY